MKAGIYRDRQDDLTKAQVISMDLHWATHKGKVFELDHCFSAVADLASVDILLRIGANRSNHIILNADAIGAYSFAVYAAPTVTGVGTEIIPLNSNYYYITRTLEAKYYYAPTVTGVGTLWFGRTIGGGKKIEAGTASLSNEKVFSHNTDFLLRLTNNSGGAQDICVNLLIIEVTAGGYI